MRVLIVLVVLLAAGWAGAGFLWPRPPAATVQERAAPGGVAGRPAVGEAAERPAVTGTAERPAGTAERPAVAEAGAAGAIPRFDIVRVGPQGSAVIAGQAAPGADVIVRDGATEVARGRADQSGSFVAIPAAPLAPGARELTLSARSGAGEVRGEGSVLLDVPAVRSAPAVAVLVPEGGAPRVLQEAPGVGSRPGLTLDTVDYDDAGAIRFTGAGPAGSTVRVYVDNGPAGDVRVDGAGRWTLTPPGDVRGGVHSLRVDQVDRDGRVVRRVELPFQRATVAAGELAGGRVVVQPGQSLWRLARLAYGRGIQYRVIYLANREQIRDPKKIYPGQTFAVPGP